MVYLNKVCFLNLCNFYLDICWWINWFWSWIFSLQFSMLMKLMNPRMTPSNSLVINKTKLSLTTQIKFQNTKITPILIYGRHQVFSKQLKPQSSALDQSKKKGLNATNQKPAFSLTDVELWLKCCYYQTLLMLRTHIKLTKL